MLTRSTDVAPQGEYYSDSLLTQPTFTSSVFDNLAAGFATPIVALNMLDDQFSKKPEGQAMLDSLNQIKLEQSTPGMGWTQWLAGEGANMIGMGLNPATWALGEVGGAVLGRAVPSVAAKIAPDAASVFMRKPIGEMISQPLGKYIPSMVGKEGAEKALSLGLISEKSLAAFGMFAGAGVPQGIVDNFNQDTNHIAWGGVAREMGEMGAFGIALGSIPFAWGILRGKINRGIGASATDGVTPEQLNQALENGHITPAEHKWYSDYMELQKDPKNVELEQDLKNRGSQIINENGHTANTVSNEAMFEILTPNDVSNLHGAISDQLTGDVPENYKKALTDFIIHNRMDYIRQKPEWLDGVRGYVDFINQKLANKNPKLLEANKILDDHLLKSVNENMPFSQKELFKMMKQSGFESSHMQHLPVTIPENMTRHIKMQEKISKLKEKLKVAKRRGQPENKQTLRRIEELEAKLPKIMTPKEELEHIKGKLLGEKGLPKNWERSNEYHRLLDLSNVWANARTLLDRVHLEHEYNRQEAFRDLAHQTLRIADSDVGKISKPDDVLNYMKARVEGQLFKAEPIADVERAVTEKKTVPTDADTILSDQEAQIRDTKAESAKEEFVQSTDKFKEFKESENIFKNLISCVLGGIGG